MGWGDSILATGHAKEIHEEGKRVYFTKPDTPHFKACVEKGYFEWEMGEDVYMHNPRLGTPETWKEDLKDGFKDAQFVYNCFGNRPYVKHGGNTQVIWNHDYRAPVGEIWLTQEEQEFDGYGKDYIFIEPHTKRMVGGNKDYFWDRWQEIADELSKDFDVLQNGIPGKKRLKNVRCVEMPEYRDALIAVANSRLVLCAQGGLHVAAAAFSKPAVVIWGEYAHPRNLGYDSHINLYTGGDVPCGHTIECPGCRAAMNRITPGMVIDAARSLS
jgi:ADP-heptose:LPS heptosyltransferase